ncbi:DNA invertase Pin-like site-specific DNA recombinase [Arthrobacter stackebrandtii]|uniref:DNA invertase Pin-like site-specific DNA recombinase n=1 Tax=Arthrobacter stackebrandtii TaxID=272161 RepID=A0ABS4YYC2_9MICC|nr:recombinase family protein [Arthrobacter stackebrandtii]MBP2413777.1 DNA invertase Pin-like site-specific DNA recombinase [Arthrobacter stackebrandtii]PYH00527.1 resolvase [Arthrobacter stackebrandtii]
METAPALRVIGYVRVSTNKQDIGPEVQIAALEAEASRKGWSLEIRRENAASAKSLANRPVLAGALTDLKSRRYDALAVSKLDRLSRNVADFSAMLETASRQGWAMICLDLGVDTTTDTGASMAQMTAVFAELERKRIAGRTREAMAKIKADTGKLMGRPSALPADTVARIFAEREAGASMARIADMLNADGVPTATGKTWHPSTVRQVLTSVTGPARS